MDWSVSHRPTFWQGMKLVYPEVPKEHPKFSQSVTVGNLVLVSGCGGKDTVTGAPAPPDVAGQVNTALDKTRAALEEAGSSMENIIKTFFLIRSLDDYGEVRKTETEYYERHAPSLIETPPSATLMVVPGLANPDYRLEYEVIAAKDRSAPDWGVTYYPEFWGGRELAFPHVPKEHAKFARTQVIGGLVAVSGCQALDHGTVRVETMDFAEQTRICLDKVRIGMEETGGSLETTAKTVVFIKDPARISEYREIERAYFAEHAPALVDNPPASTLMVVEELPRPEFLVEVEAFGGRRRHTPRLAGRLLSGCRPGRTVAVLRRHWRRRRHRGTDRGGVHRPQGLSRKCRREPRRFGQNDHDADPARGLPRHAAGRNGVLRSPRAGVAREPARQHVHPAPGLRRRGQPVPTRRHGGVGLGKLSAFLNRGNYLRDL